MLSILKKPYHRARDALAWRVRRVLSDELVDRSIVKIAQCWRPFLNKPVFLGICGSAGKTTTKLEAFQTDAFPRVKVGVGQVVAKLNHVDYVLTTFDAESRTAMDQAILTAEARVLEMTTAKNKTASISSAPL